MTQQIVFPTGAPTTTAPPSTYAAFGSDLAGTTDLHGDMRESSGLVALSESIYRRLITPRGRLIDDPNYGYDLTQFMDSDLSPTDIAQIQTGIRSECLKDQRVNACTASCTLTVANVLVVTISITTALGPFTLVLAVTSVSVAVLSSVST